MVTPDQIARYMAIISAQPKQPDIVFVDCETTGLSPYDHETIEVAAIRVDAVTLEPIDCMHCRIKPKRPVSEESLKFNNYSAKKWEDALTGGEALYHLRPLVTGAQWAGSNPSFDRKFLDALAKQTKEPKVEPCSHRMIDISAMVDPLIRVGLMPHSGVDALCKYFGLPPNGRHTAKGDVEMELALYKAIRTFYIPAVLTVFEG